MNSLKKKKKWNGIVAMALPNSIPLFTIPKVFFLPPISAMPLPQTIFFFLPYSAMALPQLPIFFFPIIWFSLRALTLRAPTWATSMGRRNCGNTIAENQKFLSYFLSFSPQLLLNFGNGIATIHSLFSD